MENRSFARSRLLSLDFFRGLTMFLLIVEFTGLFQYLSAPDLEGTLVYDISSQFQHHPWNGMFFWDLIQPFFMFIVGVAMPLSPAPARLHRVVLEGFYYISMKY